MKDASPDPAHRAIRDALRARLRAERRDLPAEERAARAARLVAHLAAASVLPDRALTAAYLAVGGEPDLGPLLDPARRRLVLPRTVGGTMTLHRWRGEPLVPGVFRIPEPPADLPEVHPADIDVWLIPGLAFDAHGNRLGRGAGHYDRALSGVPGRKIGIAWSFQVVDDIPAEPHDIPMDAVVTDAGWIDVRR